MGQVSTDFYRQVLDGIGVNLSDEKVASAGLLALRCWQRAEGGDARYNPFNTTLSMAGATDYNSAHVRNYPDERTGVRATVNTLTQGREEWGYHDIVHALRDGDALAAARAIDRSKWGTHGVEDIVRGELGHADGNAEDGPTQQDGGPGHGYIRQGQRGTPVRAVQTLLTMHGLEPANGGADGIFGPGTEHAVKAFQRDRGIAADGIVGPDTMAHLLGLHELP